MQDKGLLAKAIEFNNKKEALKESFNYFHSVYFVASDDAFENAKNFERVHTEFYKEHNKRPTIPGLVSFYAKNIGIDPNSFEYKSLWFLANRAEKMVVDEPAYHNRFHFIDVDAVTANFIAKHQQYAKQGVEGFALLSKEEVIITMAAAIGHDLDHEGYSNPKSDPVYNEEKSFQVMLPYLKASDFSADAIEKVHAILIATSPNGANQYMKAVAKANRDGVKVTYQQLDPENKFPQLAKLIDDKNLLQMAAIVVDADLYASSGAGLKSHQKSSIDLTAEAQATGVNLDFTTVQSSNFFFANIVGADGFASNVARKIANPSFLKLFEETKQVVANLNKKPNVSLNK